MNRKKRNRRRFLLIALCAFVLAAALTVRFRYVPFLREAARTRVVNVASERINDAINAQISSGAVDYSRIIYLEKDVNGNITALRTNMAEVNRLKTLTLELLCGDLLEMDTEELCIPLGSILMPSFFAGKGPGLPIRIIALSTSDADFYSEFSAAGINQTLQRILLEIRLCMSIQTAAGIERVDVSTQIVVAETVIVGKVPETYFELGAPPGA